MKKSKNAVKAVSYTAGIFIIASALLLAVLLFMCALGFIYPRKEHIAIRTESYSKIFDAEPISGGAPMLTYGSLHSDLKITTVSQSVYTKVGVYKNEPEFIITDSSGTDVTDMYIITADYGEIVISGRPITVYCPDREKIYDGTPLTSDEITLLQSEGTLFEGHTFVCTAVTSLTEPGEAPIASSYRIINEWGADVTDQYSIAESIGKLTVHPIPIKVRTNSYNKYYDALPLAEGGLSVVAGEMLPGHIMITVYDEYTDVGSYPNKPEISVIDIHGNDVNKYYNIDGTYGIITIKQIPLNITTASAEKIYDGEPISCAEWSITSGYLLEGDSISVSHPSSLESVGKIENQMQFKVTDKNGNDVTSRYALNTKYGTLYISPRVITIRTGSASKVYDGEALVCEEYEIISGSLCEGEEIEISFTSIINIGYSDNYVVALTVIRNEADGTKKDVSFCYSITYDCGMLTVTAN